MSYYIKGISLSTSEAEDGVWADSDHSHEFVGPLAFGLLVKLRYGWVVRPILHPRWWFKKDKPNVWFDTGDDVRWFVFRCWLPILPYLSFFVGSFGVYIGVKEFSLDPEREQLADRYKAWLPAHRIGKGSKAGTISASIRRSRRY